MLTLWIAFMLGATPAAPSHSEPPVETTTIVIPAAGYDFSNPRDVRKFDRDARTLIAEQCGEPSNVDLVGQRIAKACRASALGDIRKARDERVAAANNARPARTASRP